MSGPITGNQVELQSIRLQAMAVDVDFDFDPGMPNQRLIANFGVQGQKVSRGASMLPDGTSTPAAMFITTFIFKFFHEGADPMTAKAVASISADMTSSYVWKAFEEMDDDKLNQWGAGSAVHHQWPYWRELCHSTLARMALPVILMPLAQLMAPPVGNPDAPAVPAEAAPTQKAPSRVRKPKLH